MNNVVRTNTTTYYNTLLDEEKSQSFLAACQNDDGDTVRSFILSGGIDINFQDQCGNTGLMIAALSRSFNMCRLLLENGANPNVQNDFGGVALTSLCRRGEYALVELLLRYGADPNVLSGSAENPFICACQAGDKSMVALLLASGRVTPHTMDRALLAVAQNGLHDVASLLIENGARPNLIDRNGYTALFQLKMDSPRRWKTRNRGVMESRYTLKEYTKFLERTKFICSMTNIFGPSKYTDGKRSIEFSRNGAPHGAFFVSKLIKCCSLFIQNGQRLVDCGEINHHDKLDERMTTLADVLQSYQMGSAGREIIEDEIAQRYLDGNPVFIRSGFRGHMVMFVLYAGHIALVDRIHGSRKPILVYTLPEEWKTVEGLRHHIHLMHTSIDCDTAHFDRFILDTLQYLPRGQLEQLLEECLRLPHQGVVDCSWLSIQGAIFALFGLTAVEEAGFLPGQECNERARKNISLALCRARALVSDFTWFCISTYGEKYKALREDLKENDILLKIDQIRIGRLQRKMNI